MEQDFPLVRAQLRCPLCQGAKQAGALVCWPCYRRYEMRYGDEQLRPACCAKKIV